LGPGPILWIVSRRRATAAIAAVVAAFAATAVPARAATRSATSSNWAGYAVSRSGVSFNRVSGTWVQPQATCTSRRHRYSAYWLGLGGLHTTSKALEQIGTEADCVGSKAQYSIWYEIVPAAPVTLKMSVRRGDTISASVSVSGHTVKLNLANHTRGTVFSKQLQGSHVNRSSAEWIAEAPSACDGAGNCETLPLTNFGSASFGTARATSSTGHIGTITDPAWSVVKITLTTDRFGHGGPGFLTDGGGAASATPAQLNATGDAFAVLYDEGNTSQSATLAATRQP
jgi:Peptidase A4 family